MTGSDLREWRKSMGYTQGQAADALGCGLRTYQKWEVAGASKVVQLATQALSIKAAWPAALNSVRVVSALVRDH